MTQERPYGTWPSAITAEVVAAQGVRLGAVAVEGDDVYWLEGRPNEGGRNALVRRRPDGSQVDVVPADFNVRTRVHEYGGGAYVVHKGVVFFSNFTDQRVYRISAGEKPHPITPEGKCFYADYSVDPVRNRLVCVREDHSGEGEAITTLVSIPLDDASHAGDVMASGHDFYSTPRFSPDGSQIAWLAWRHPNMPWDGTELWLADVGPDGAIAGARVVAGGPDESIYQPGWAPDGSLYFVSDRDEWWRLYRVGAKGAISAVLRTPPEEAEFGRPQWVFGTSTWAFVGPSRMAAAYTQHGRWLLADVNTETGEWRRVETDLEPHDWMAADPAAPSPSVIVVAGSPSRADSIVRLNLSSGHTSVLRASSTLELRPGDVSVAQSMQFSTAESETGHALYYGPVSSACGAPPDTRPPLIAISHGGPTTATTATLDLRIQFWTSRGFAVVDVNYRGSSGYGRTYRNALRLGYPKVAFAVSTPDFVQPCIILGHSADLA